MEEVSDIGFCNTTAGQISVGKYNQLCYGRLQVYLVSQSRIRSLLRDSRRRVLGSIEGQCIRCIHKYVQMVKHIGTTWWQRCHLGQF